MVFQLLVDDIEVVKFFVKNIIIVFLNDVVICLEDIFEFVYQKCIFGVDMMCVMDWIYVGLDLIFYDVWIV